jgi:hypothetical protein
MKETRVPRTYLPVPVQGETHVKTGRGSSQFSTQAAHRLDERALTVDADLRTGAASGALGRPVVLLRTVIELEYTSGRYILLAVACPFVSAP